MITKRRFIVVLAVAVLAAAACTRGDDEAEVTPQPTDEALVEDVARFQLVGTITKAFAGIEPPIDVPSEDATVTGPTDEPDETPVGSQPATPGVLRIELEDANQDLTDACGIAEGQQAVVYWTSGTSFDPEDVLDDVENEIEDRVAGISGRVFRPTSEVADDEASEPTEEAEPTEQPDLADASPFAIGSPDTEGSVFGDEGNCVLVAEQVGFEEDEPDETRAPSVRRTAAPTARATETPEPDATDEPDETSEPRESPATSATPTAEEQ